MKKSYRKPLVYCENHDTGAAVSNSEEYEQEMKRKLEMIKKTESLNYHISENKPETDYS